MSEPVRTGADVLVETLADCGVTHCFANPGTSEMHLVQALDREARVRTVLCLFEGVATGAADGFARIAGVPAMTLLHLGPGYGNGLANIHNARRAHAPMVNVVGDHATHHRHLDAPLTSNIASIVAANSLWVDVVERADDAGRLAAEAFARTHGPPGGPVTLILPADSAWNEAQAPAAPPAPVALVALPPEAVQAAAQVVQAAAKPMILVGGEALWRREGLAAMARLKAAGVRVMIDTFPARQARGAGRFAPDRMQYFAEGAMADLAGCDLMVLAGTTTPCAFFAYPERPSVLVPEGCTVHPFSARSDDTVAALAVLADALGAPSDGPVVEAAAQPARPTGPLTPFACAQSLARHLPADAIISDDAVTAGLPHYMATLQAAPHDWLFLTGGAIGQGLPLAVGTACAAPQRKTVALTGDGAGMYTVQALWTMARERLPVVTVVFANRSYRILNIEMARTGAGNPGPAARSMLSLDNPALDWVKLAEGHGVAALRADTAEAFDDALARALAMDEPVLIEAVI
jgi:acetolactate synthase I/II/III large subunit